MKRKVYIVENADMLRIADAETHRAICTMPRDEIRLARFIARCVNWFGFGLRRYDRNDWIWDNGKTQAARRHASMR